MDKSDLKEIRKVVKSKDTVVDWIYGVYVNADNVPVWENAEKLIGMEEAEQFRYQTLFSKALSTHLGRDSFPIQIEAQNAELLSLRETKGQSVSEFAGFRDSLLAGYAHTDPYYATLTKIVYDVPAKSKDGRKLEDGDLVYQALLFAISPAKLTQPTLGFDEDRVTELDRRWQIGNPVSSFLYPAFDGRLENRNEVLVHSAAPDEEDFINGLFHLEGSHVPVGVKAQKEVFSELLGQMDCTVEKAAAITENIVEKATEEDASPVLEKETLRKIVSAAGLGTEDFDEMYDDTVGDTPIAMDVIAEPYVTVRTDAALVRLPADKAQLVETRRIDGRDYILIPADGTVTVNGVAVSAAEIARENRAAEE